MKITFMKHTLIKVLSLSIYLSVALFCLSSCYSSYEGGYYHRYGHHHREWYGAHHQPEPAGVNWNVDVDVRH